MGEARHFKTNMCHTRFTPEQLRDSDRCYEDKSKPKKDCACCELYKKQGGRYGDRDIFDEDNYIHRLLKMPKVVKKRRHGKPPKFMKRKK